ncbi:G5 domain-containing protein [Anaerotignum lactatifermentans]|uniref:G5 domain-containing protein n=1 Tax=Anaerotignum lactatifermentans TaxID=160404 RepID=A0ABS2GB39_9FIRM|nr:G5 domain-containing protein [Anaerotignum lactatifermentans]MBM6878656.1 G5 domain-containing protein [Anaerotignum lactatifermentans]MBM6951721.1 G5 domain-containing protein [Anaerotignum lactatifermentans]
MADRNKKELFPKREERVPYGGGKPVRTSGKKEKKGKEKKPRRVSAANKGGGKRLSPKQTLILAAAVVVLVVLFVCFRKNGVEVFVADQSMGILKDTSITDTKLKETLEAQLAESVGTAVQINETITVEKIHIGGDKKSQVCTMEYLLPQLRNAVTYKVQASVIFVDGGAVTPLATQTEAEQVLEQLKEPYLPQDETSNAEISFVETVEIQSQFVDSEEILSVEEALNVLTGTTPVTQTYTVQTGDGLAKIAAEYDMTTEELLAANEGMTVSTPIYVGQVLNVIVDEPMVSVKSVETQVLTTVEKKTYEYQQDNTKPSSYQKVIQQGKDGQKKSTIQITRINGFITEEKEVSKEVITEAVPEIIVRGTL